jgi:hypothetical protein
VTQGVMPKAFPGGWREMVFVSPRRPDRTITTGAVRGMPVF